MTRLALVLALCLPAAACSPSIQSDVHVEQYVEGLSDSLADATVAVGPVQAGPNDRYLSPSATDVLLHAMDAALPTAGAVGVGAAHAPAFGRWAGGAPLSPEVCRSIATESGATHVLATWLEERNSDFEEDNAFDEGTHTGSARSVRLVGELYEADSGRLVWRARSRAAAQTGELTRFIPKVDEFVEEAVWALISGLPTGAAP